MLDTLTITEEEALGLAELAQLDLAMARDFAARAQAAEDPDTANELARSYQRVARSYRQTLALKARLARELAQTEREARLNPPPFDPRAARRRMDEVRQAVARVAWAEYEGAEHEGPEREEAYEETLAIFEDVVTDLISEPGFHHAPLDEQVAEACAMLGLSATRAARWRELPDPPDPDAAPEPDAAHRDTG